MGLDAQAGVLSVPTTGVGQQSQPFSITVTMSASGLATGPQALTQGVAGLDFSIAPGGTCAANTLYVSGQQCTVSVVFAPKYPGLRSGAVAVKGTDGSLLGAALLAGIGTGSLSVLNPGIINTLAGDGELNFRSDNVPAVEAPIFLPYGVIVDPVGNIFLSDTNNSRIRRVDAQSGLISTVAGNGTSGYAGDGGPATLAMISQPSGLAMDGGGNIYFADSGNSIIRRIDAVSGFISTVAGVPLGQGYSGDGSTALSARLSSPRGVAFDTAGDLFIADTGNNVIREINVTTDNISTVAGNGTEGYNGDNLTATGAQLNTPWTVSVGTDGSLYIADLSNNRIRKVSGGVISTVAGSGNRGFTGDHGPANVAGLDDPSSVTVDPAGNLYIADSGNNRIRKVYSATGIIETLSGNDSYQFSGDGGPATLASLYAPYGLSFDAIGDLFVADTLHNRIRRILATPLPLTYPVMRVGKTSAPQIVAIENDGNSNLVLNAPTLNNAALDPATTTCSFTTPIAPSATCNLGVEFAPTVVGNNVLGSVTLNSNSGSSPVIVNLSGQVLSVEPTSVTLTSNVNPSLLGQAVALTATVASADPSRSGPVTFLDGTTPLCSSVNLTAGSATCTTSALTLGQHNLTASYAGDTNNAASVSAVLLQTVKQQATLVLSASPNPAIVTQNITLTLTATAATGTPSGSVVFYDGTSALSGNISLNASGVATFSTTQLTPGSHSLSTQYSGDTTNTSATSSVVTEVVKLASTVSTLGSSNSNATVGSTVTLTATVTDTDGLVPTGTAQFTEGSMVLGTGAVDSNGHATLVLSSLSPGAHTISATYSGDTDSSGSSSSPLVQTIQQIATVTVLATDTNPSAAGATIRLTATIGVGGGGAPDGPITGLVTFSEGTTILGTAQVSTSDTASIAVNTLTPGQHNIVASYPGNTNYATSNSNTLVQSITTTSTTTTLSTGGASSLSGKPVTLSAGVTSPTGIPAGSVIFQDGGTNIGQGTLSAQGIATLTTSSLSVGSHTLTATYQGNASYITSNSAPVTENISLGTSALTLAGPANPVDVGTPVTLTTTLTSNGIAPTGALTLRDGNVVIATQNIANAGTFSFSVSTLTVGVHTLTAAYAGDSNTGPAVSTSFSVTIQRVTSMTSLADSPNPALAGQSVTLTATVSSTGANSTGLVSFQDSGTVIGSASVSANGTAVFVTSSLSIGAHMLSAVYAGDTNHASSTSPAIAEQIVQPASIALSSGLNPSIAGVNVVFTAKLGGIGSLIPTGQVTFNVDSVVVATAQLDSSGAASFQTSTLSVGSHSITASYAGDKNYAAATSTSLIQTVQSANTQVVLSSSANPATYGVALSLTATITSNGGVATGTVTFTDGGTAIGGSALNAGGVATLTTASLAPGLHLIVANYAGDGRASASTSTPLTVIVRQVTAVGIATSANPALTLTSILLTATVTNNGVTPVTGTVTFSDGAAQLGTAAVSTSGHATLTLPSLAAGNHAIVASYEGDANDFPSTSAVLTQTVQLRATTTSVTGLTTDPDKPQQVTLIGIVRSTGTVMPTGSITFTDGNVLIGTSQMDASGTATITIDVDTNTTENVVATYNGDASYMPSASPVTSIAGGTPTQFTIALDPSSMTIQSKQHSVIQLTATSINGFADTLQFGCLGLPFAATCTFSSVQTNLAANGTSVVQLTIDTGDALGSGALAGIETAHPSNTLMCLLPGAGLAGFVLLYRRRRLSPGLLLILCGLMATMTMTGCAGLQTNGTPAGTYTFKVTASGQGTGTTESQMVGLTVTQ